ncbi:MAG: tagatose-6-phosphate ketose isomerase [Acidobacteriaceae bacterium]
MDPLSALLSLPASEKLERGILYTPQEIAQQPDTWERTFAGTKRRQAELQEFLTRAGVRSEVGARPTVFLIGAGTSDYIGHSLHPLLRRMWQCEVIPVSSTNLLVDFADHVLTDRNYLWISFSRSGDSPEGVAVLERALAECPKVRHVLVTCNRAGQMARAIEGRNDALAVVLDDAINDRGLAMTSSFTNMVLSGQILAHAWTLNEYEPILQALCDAGRSFSPRAAVLASEFAAAGFSRACFVGSGGLTGAAMECALKLLELTAGKVQTMSQATLALRHGPMASLDRNTLFVSLVSGQTQRRRYEMDLLDEIGRKGIVRSRIAITTDNPEALRGSAEHVLAPETPGTIPDAYRPMLDVMFGQLLGLFASLHFGLKPDSPSPDGVISRVVQNVGIY